jgi:hypothetical protein
VATAADSVVILDPARLYAESGAPLACDFSYLARD